MSIKNSGTPGSATPTIYVGLSQTGNNLYRSTDAGATGLNIRIDHTPRSDVCVFSKPHRLTIVAGVGRVTRSPLLKSDGAFPVDFGAPWKMLIGVPSAASFSSMNAYPVR